MCEARKTGQLTRFKVSKLHNRISNIRKDFVHKSPACGKVTAKNRKTQEKFTRVECGVTVHADFVAAVNIKEAGLALLACPQSSAKGRPSWQAPTEGIRAYA